jgi:hypothetical protein
MFRPKDPMEGDGWIDKHVIRITSNVIGFPALEIPVDADIDKAVSSSGGQMAIPCLLIQVLRELRSVEERLQTIESAITDR